MFRFFTISQDKEAEDNQDIEDFPMSDTNSSNSDDVTKVTSPECCKQLIFSSVISFVNCTLSPIQGFS